MFIGHRPSQGQSPNCDFTTTARHSLASHQGGEAASNRLLRHQSHGVDGPGTVSFASRFLLFETSRIRELVIHFDLERVEL